MTTHGGSDGHVAHRSWIRSWGQNRAGLLGLARVWVACILSTSDTLYYTCHHIYWGSPIRWRAAHKWTTLWLKPRVSGVWHDLAHYRRWSLMYRFHNLLIYISDCLGKIPVRQKLSPHRNLPTLETPFDYTTRSFLQPLGYLCTLSVGLVCRIMCTWSSWMLNSLITLVILYMHHTTTASGGWLLLLAVPLTVI